MRSRLIVVLAALVGCGGAPPTAAPAAAKATASRVPEAEKPACITAPEEAATIAHATANETRIQYCVGAAADQCFSIELGSGKLTHLVEPPKGDAAGAASRIETTNPELKVCTGTTCKALTPQIWPGAAQPHAATNGSFAVVLLGDAESGKGYADVYDVVKSKKVTTFRYAHGDFRCGEVAMLGETIYIGASTCAGPSARAALYSVKGRKIANVGTKDFGTFGNAFVQIDPTTWAFLDENGNKVVVQDVVKGKVLKTIDVSALFHAAGSTDAIGNPGESAVVRIGADKLAVIGGSPANGSVATIDLSSSEVKVVRAPFCH